MQYLSQRLAARPARARGGSDPDRPVAVGQRSRLLDAAERVAADRGCAAATIERIVRRAGVSSASFYEHFDGKEGCLLAAFERAADEWRAGLIGAVPAGLPWADQIREGLRWLLEAIDAEPARARFCLVEAQKGGRALAARYEAALDGAAPKLREGRRLDTAGRLPEGVETATIGGIAWLLRERLELGGGPGGTALDLHPRLVSVALSPYLGDG